MARLTRQRNAAADSARGFHSRPWSDTVPCMYQQYTPRCTWRGVEGQRCSETAAEWPVLPCCPLPVVVCWAHLSADEAEHCHAIRDASGRWLWTGDAGDEPDAPSVSVFRAAWANAYDPWSHGDDERMLHLWNESVGITDIAEEFGRHPETVRARLALLGVAGMPASATAFAIQTYRERPPAPAVTAASPPPPPQRQPTPTPYQLLDGAGVPFNLRTSDWLELAMLIECGTCFAEPGTPCAGPEAIDVGNGVIVCPSRPEDIPEIEAERCPHCTSYLVERSWGWHETCWSRSKGPDKAAFTRERTSVWDDKYRRDQRFLTVDVEAATRFWCGQCGVTPRVPCREVAPLFSKPGLKVPEAGVHPARVRNARSYRRARNYLESLDRVGPFG